MAPDEAQDAPAPMTPDIAPGDYIQRAPETNGGETAPPETFGVAGDPEAAREQALRGEDPRGEQAPERDQRDEPSG